MLPGISGITIGMCEGMGMDMKMRLYVGVGMPTILGMPIAK